MGLTTKGRVWQKEAMDLLSFVRKSVAAATQKGKEVSTKGSWTAYRLIFWPRQSATCGIARIATRFGKIA
jgi:hypothetical protein